MSRIAFIGLGAMGLGMALRLVKSGFHVVGFDINPDSISTLVSAGGHAASTASEAIKGADLVIMMVVSAAQIDTILFDEKSPAAASLTATSRLMICSTVAPPYPEALQARLARYGTKVIDCPVSGGVIRAAEGKLKIFASASEDVSGETFTRKVLNTLASDLVIVPGGLGAATKLKLLNQLLAGVHIAAAAEATALAIALGLNLRQFYRAVVASDSSSWMFENRVLHILEADWTPHSALDIFVKDMGIVTTEGSRLSFSMPLVSTTHQLYMLGSLNGYGREDDSGLIRIYLGRDTLARAEETETVNDAEETVLVISALRGVHVVVAAEAFALATRLGLEPALLFDGVKGAAGSSCAFEAHGAHLVHHGPRIADFNTVSRGLVS